MTRSGGGGGRGLRSREQSAEGMGDGKPSSHWHARNLNKVLHSLPHCVFESSFAPYSKLSPQLELIFQFHKEAK